MVVVILVWPFISFIVKNSCSDFVDRNVHIVMLQSCIICLVCNDNIHNAARRLTNKSRSISKTRDMCLRWLGCSEICQASVWEWGLCGKGNNMNWLCLDFLYIKFLSAWNYHYKIYGPFWIIKMGFPKVYTKNVIIKRHQPSSRKIKEVYILAVCPFQSLKHAKANCCQLPYCAGLIIGLRPFNERRCYFVTTSLIGWAQT